MNRLYERIAILVICLAGYTVSEISLTTVILFLVTIGISALIQLIPTKERTTGRQVPDTAWKADIDDSSGFISSGLLHMVIIGIACGICGWVPAFISSFPLLMYEALWIKRWYAILPVLLVVRNIHMINPTADVEINPSVLILAIAGTVVAICMYISIYRGDNAISNYHRLRDELAEKNEQLRSQNERLLDAQNTEIYLATLKERNRIAREIHDNVGHMLTRSLLQVGAIKTINKDEVLEEPLDGLRDTLDQAMTSVRSSVHDLYDESIDLKAVLGEYLSVMGDSWQTELIYHINDPAEMSVSSAHMKQPSDVEDISHPTKQQPKPDDHASLMKLSGDEIPGSVKICFAGIAKEAITNAIKHSNGDKLKVELTGHPGFFRLVVMDNGNPLSKNTNSSPGSANSSEERHFTGTDIPDDITGIGLKNMSDRVSAVHGRISFSSSSSGFRVEVTVPR